MKRSITIGGGVGFGMFVYPTALDMPKKYIKVIRKFLWKPEVFLQSNRLCNLKWLQWVYLKETYEVWGNNTYKVSVAPTLINEAEYIAYFDISSKD